MLLMPGLQLSGVGRSYGLSPGLEILPAGKSALRRQQVARAGHMRATPLCARGAVRMKNPYLCPFPFGDPRKYLGIEILLLNAEAEPPD